MRKDPLHRRATRSGVALTDRQGIARLVLIVAVFGLALIPFLTAAGAPGHVESINEIDKAGAHAGEQDNTEAARHESAVETQTTDQHEGESHEAEHEAHGDSGFLAKLVNFLVLFGGLTILLRKPISAMLGQRADDIRTSMTEAEESNKTAKKKLKTGQKRLDEMAVEVKQINIEAEEAGRMEREDILTAAKEEMKRIKKLAAQEIDVLSQVGLKELKTYAAEMATSLARESIIEKVKTADQASLIDKAIDRLETLYEGEEAR